ncbi:hypothetical protein FB45DRAFT_1004272 [Roridomyces roridus]|uniref:Uncharacterized protein n=1 Tax=Roridomyces roridus TaxID=1738132 RepID=A0AAD7FNC1_9AGAR|nr:hypothetical protein FB45DRAFT_1004272 [Roridomyces roridus]
MPGSNIAGHAGTSLAKVPRMVLKLVPGRGWIYLSLGGVDTFDVAVPHENFAILVEDCGGSMEDAEIPANKAILAQVQRATWTDLDTLRFEDLVGRGRIHAIGLSCLRPPGRYVNALESSEVHPSPGLRLTDMEHIRRFKCDTSRPNFLPRHLVAIHNATQAGRSLEVVRAGWNAELVSPQSVLQHKPADVIDVTVDAESGADDGSGSLASRDWVDEGNFWQSPTSSPCLA